MPGKSWFVVFLAPAFCLGCPATAGPDDGATNNGAADVGADDGRNEPPELRDPDRAEFVDIVDNRYFPLSIGATWSYETTTPEGVERTEVEVLAETREIQGVTATVVRDTVSVDGELLEDTRDWFAQDTDGNVWYLGEETCEYEGGDCVDTQGSWEWGVDGAKPGLVMPANPMVTGQRYYQEFYPGEAEDAFEVVAIGLDVATPVGSFTDCIETRESSTLDTTLDENKFYCPGVGLVRVEEPDANQLLVDYTLP